MGIAITLQNYLTSEGVDFDVVEHYYTEGSINTAQAAHIPTRKLAKGVVFRDEDLHYTMAVLPSQNKVKRHTLNQIFDRRLELADEDELDDLFQDCSHGAIPALGQAYEINVIWDDELLETDEIYMEAGDHEHLIHITKDQFERLMNSFMHEHFSSTLPGLELERSYRPSA